MEPEVLREIPSGQMYDFSKNLFPKLFEEGKPLYGYLAEGYWCDIGNIAQYRQAHIDMLSGKVKQEIAGTEIAPEIYVGSNVSIDPSAKSMALQSLEQLQHTRLQFILHRFGHNDCGSGGFNQAEYCLEGCYLGVQSALRVNIIPPGSYWHQRVSL